MRLGFLSRLAYREIGLTKRPEEKENAAKSILEAAPNKIGLMLAKFCIKNDIPRVLSGLDRLIMYFQDKGYKRLVAKQYSAQQDGYYFLFE